jgi:hypothetical protein
MQTNDFYRGLLSELRTFEKTSGNPTSPQAAPLAKPVSTTQGIGQGLGWATQKIENHPYLSALPTGGLSLAAKPVSNALVDYSHTNVGLGSQTPESGKATNPFFQGFLQTNHTALDRLNDNAHGLPSQTLGAATYNPQTNSIDTSFGNAAKYIGNKAMGWVGQHPWTAALGGGGGLAAALALMLRSNQQNPPVQPGPMNQPVPQPRFF